MTLPKHHENLGCEVEWDWKIKIKSVQYGILSLTYFSKTNQMLYKVGANQTLRLDMRLLDLLARVSQS